MRSRKEQQQQGHPGPKFCQPLTWSSCSPWACKVGQSELVVRVHSAFGYRDEQVTSGPMPAR